MKLTPAVLLLSLAATALGQQPQPNPALPVAPVRVGAEPNAALRYYQVWESLSPEIQKAVGEQYNADGDKWPDEALTKMLVENQRAIEDLIRTTQIEHCDWGVQYDQGWNALLPHLGKMRQSCRLLVCDARRLLRDEKPVEAARRLAAVYRMSLHASQDPVLIGTLVGVAICAVGNTQTNKLLDHNQLTPEAAREILNAARAIPTDDFMGAKTALRMEEWLGCDWPRAKFSGDTAGAQFVAMFSDINQIENGPGAAATAEPIRKMNKEQFDASIDRAREVYELTLKAWDEPDAPARLKQIEERLEKHEFGAVAGIIAPAMTKAYQNVTKGKAEIIATIKKLETFILTGKAPQPEAAPATPKAGKQ